MKSIQKILLICFTGMLLSSCQSEKVNPFGSLSKIEGEWSMSFGNSPESGTVVESWSKVNDTLFLGKSYEVVDGDSTLIEIIQLVASDGEIFYNPTTREQKKRQPVSFRLIQKSNDKFIFENKEHDFPTTIMYEFKNDSTLTSAISGKIKGEEKGMEFFYKKVNGN